MRRTALAALLMLLAGPAGAEPAMLRAFQGKSPVILMFAPSAEDGRLLRQADELSKLEAKPFYQSVIIASVTSEGVMGLADSAGALRARFGVAPRSFAVIAVGASGQVLLRREQVSDELALETALGRATRGADAGARGAAAQPPGGQASAQAKAGTTPNPR